MGTTRVVIVSTIEAFRVLLYGDLSTIETFMEPTEVAIPYSHPRVFVRQRVRHAGNPSFYRLLPSSNGGHGRDRSNVCLASSVREWMEGNISGEWDDMFDTGDGRSRIFRFANRGDALLFKLTWG